MTKWAFAILCLFVLSSFAQAAEPAPEAAPQDTKGMFASLPGAVQSLLHYALDFQGVSYQRGGSNPESGFDCSGFVRYVFDRVDGLALPHSASAISQIGVSLKMNELQPGDLVFFHFMRHTISHVGIYLGNEQFIHASSTRTGSVMVSSLNDGYWAKHFSLGRHLDVENRQLEYK
jgi:cell wall-associated NlpC family hydrolase